MGASIKSTAEMDQVVGSQQLRSYDRSISSMWSRVHSSSSLQLLSTRCQPLSHLDNLATMGEPQVRVRACECVRVSAYPSPVAKRTAESRRYIFRSRKR